MLFISQVCNNTNYCYWTSDFDKIKEKRAQFLSRYSLSKFLGWCLMFLTIDFINILF